MSDNVLTLKRDGVPVLGYRRFHSPDELARRQRALERGEVAPVIELKRPALDPNSAGPRETQEVPGQEENPSSP